MFEKILIANRGEIAVRIARACRELGIASVAVYSDADREALHVQVADEAYRIGPAPAAESYLHIPTLIEAARSSGAQAVHPGYGFLSENAEFAEACAAAGLVFIGPPAAAIRLMGDKIAAKEAAEAVGVPVVPDYRGPDTTPDRLLAAAGEIGFPILVKAAAGGGGKGMRVVEAPADLADAVEAARREARGAFGDDRVFLERYLTRPRHVEIQVLADTQGHVVHLGERECSIQRRHQKVIEESPSPVLTPELRAAMGEAAVALTRSTGYVNAGTVEFILDASGAFYFLEMNTRLQVEHPVTELVTGRDLVHLQIAVAAGDPLPFDQAAVRQAGHAIEARVYAEDPARGFLPATGRLTAFVPPTGPGVRNDVGVYPGAEVTVHYDPMLAKLIVHGPDRPAAIERLQNALAAYRVEGVATNLPFLRWLADHPSFAAGETTTDFIDRHFRPEVLTAAPPDDLVIGAAALDLLGLAWAPPGAALEARRPGGADPWRSAGPWRQLRAGLPLAYRIDDRPAEVRATHLGGTNWRLSIADRVYLVALAPGAAGRAVVQIGDRTLVFEAAGDRPRRLTWRGRTHRVDLPEPPTPEQLAQGAHAGAGGQHSLRSPMPGTVVRVLVAEGEHVDALQSLVILEAMKMEHVIQAPYAGTVRAIHFREGELVPGDAALVDLESD